VTPAATIALIVLALAGSLEALTSVFLFYGACLGAWDVGMNIVGVGVERAFRRPIMAGLHAMYSVGFMLGTLCGSAAAALHLPTLIQFSAVALCVVIASQFGTQSLLRRGIDDAPGGRSGPSSDGRKRTVLDEPRLLATGFIAFCGLFAEGTVSNWSGIFLHDVRHVSYAIAPIGASACAVMMATGRLTGDAVIMRLGRYRTLRITSVLASMGLIAAVCIPSPVVAIAGFGIFGLTAACIVPIAFTLAGNIPGTQPAWAISRVATAGYGGSLSSPATIGFVAHLAGLVSAMLLPAGLLVAVGQAVRGVKRGRSGVLLRDDPG
jgi:fucose permease